MGVQKSWLIYSLFRRYSVFPLYSNKMFSHWLLNSELFLSKTFMFLLVTHMITMDYRNSWIKKNNALRAFHAQMVPLSSLHGAFSCALSKALFECLRHGGKTTFISQLVSTLFILYKTFDDCRRNIGYSLCPQIQSKAIET